MLRLADEDGWMSEIRFDLESVKRREERIREEMRVHVKHCVQLATRVHWSMQTIANSISHTSSFPFPFPFLFPFPSPLVVRTVLAIVPFVSNKSQKWNIAEVFKLNGRVRSTTQINELLR